MYYWGRVSADDPEQSDDWNAGWLELKRSQFRQSFADVLSATPGGLDELRSLVDPNLLDLVDSLEPSEIRSAHSDLRPRTWWGIDSSQWTTTMRLHDGDGALAGFLWIQKPSAGMSAIDMVTGGGDTRHLDRIYSISESARRPAAILFADLEASTQLSRTLSTAEYFTLARRLVRAADTSVVDAGGIVGRHLGDGVDRVLPRGDLGSESAAARACIEASRNLRTRPSRSPPGAGWVLTTSCCASGSTGGRRSTWDSSSPTARAEVTAMGDEVNEAARIEACASGGRTLASKDLVERLDETDARSLGINGSRTRRSASSRRRRTRHGGMRRPSPSATSESRGWRSGDRSPGPPSRHRRSVRGDDRSVPLAGRFA